jgi:hypothetical protein
MTLKTTGIQRQGLAGKQCLMTFAAAAPLRQPRNRQPIDAVTVWTNDVQSFRHDLCSLLLDTLSMGTPKLNFNPARSTETVAGHIQP